jgi:hypothetical protein
MGKLPADDARLDPEMLERDASECPQLDVSDLEDGGDEIGQGFGLTMEEKFCLGFIAANPDSFKTDRQRLTEAMRALFNRDPSGNPIPGEQAYIDHQAILFMAGKDRRDVLSLMPPGFANSGQTDTDTRLAEEAQKKYFPTDDPELAAAIVKRLREKYSGAYERKQVRAKLMRGSISEEQATTDLNRQHRMGFYYEANVHDFVLESLELQGLRRIDEELVKWKIKFVADPGY